MKTNYLLPNSFKKAGWVFFILGAGCGLFYLFRGGPDLSFFNVKVLAVINGGFGPTLGKGNQYFQLIENNIFDEIICLLLIFGSILIAFSKEKREDEFISRIRLESLVWATYINYGILVVSILLVYVISFFLVLEFNMFTILMFFLIRFNWILYKEKHLSENEE